MATQRYIDTEFMGTFSKDAGCREEGRADGQREKRPRDEKEKDISGCLSRPLEASLQYPK